MSVPLVLLPGLICDRTIWAAQAAALNPEFEIHAMPDFYGHDLLRSMAEAVLARTPRRFALAGHSMGARVALEIMARAPERVEKLALVSTGVAPATPDEPARREEFLALARSQGIAAVVARWLPMIVHPDRVTDSVLMERLSAMMCRAKPDDFAGQVYALLNRPDFRPLLPRIFRPTLVACGRQDSWTPLAQHEEFSKAILGAELAVIEDCGHMATMEQPEALSTLLRNWMRR